MRLLTLASSPLVKSRYLGWPSGPVEYGERWMGLVDLIPKTIFVRTPVLLLQMTRESVRRDTSYTFYTIGT